MQAISNIEKNRDTGFPETNVTLNAREADALNATVVQYLQTHEDDPSDNIYQRLKQLRKDLIVIIDKLKPS